MRSDITIYLEHHDAPYFLTNHKVFLQSVLFHGKTCLLVEYSRKSKSFKALNLYLKDLKNGHDFSWQHYQDIAKTSPDYRRYQFRRELDVLLYLSKSPKLFSSLRIWPVDYRNSRKGLKEFYAANDFLVVRFTTAKPGKSLSLEALEEAAFFAWHVDRALAKAERRGYRNFLFFVGALHFAPLARYLAKEHRHIRFYRLPFEGEYAVLPVEISERFVKEHLDKCSPNLKGQHLQYFEFFLGDLYK